MRQAILTVVGLLIAGFFATAGALMAVSAKNFLRFYDFCFRGDYVGRTAQWRNDVDNVEWKIAGVALIGIALLFAWGMLR